jgi:hypothetical protein
VIAAGPRRESARPPTATMVEAQFERLCTLSVARLDRDCPTDPRAR